MRRSWRAGADCKSVGLSLRWFESTHSHQEMPTKYGRFFLCPNRADFRDVFRVFCGENILYVYRVRQNTLFFQNYIQCRFFNWRLTNNSSDYICICQNINHHFDWFVFWKIKNSTRSFIVNKNVR